MPSDQTTPLGRQLHNIMSLRLVLLHQNRSPPDQQLAESIATLYESYVRAGRSRPDITLMLARDFEFHSRTNRPTHLPARPVSGPAYQGTPPQALPYQLSVPTMQRLSIGGGASTAPRPRDAPRQLDHTHHGRPAEGAAGDEGRPDGAAAATCAARSSESAPSASPVSERTYSGGDFRASQHGAMDNHPPRLPS